MGTVHSLSLALLLSITFVSLYAQNDNSDRLHIPHFQLSPFNAAQKDRQGRRSGQLRETEETEGTSTTNLHFERTTNNDSVVRFLERILFHDDTLIFELLNGNVSIVKIIYCITN
jgi:hypothetical protein